MQCDRCNQTIIRPSEYLPGYGTIDGQKLCYACCADVERESMIRTGKATLYLVSSNETILNGNAAGLSRKVYEVTDWPGKLRFSVPHVRRSVHNLATWRYDFQFTGPDGKVWSGVNYGDNTQIARCKRLKKQPK
jgi:hypothetical protein